VLFFSSVLHLRSENPPSGSLYLLDSNISYDGSHFNISNLFFCHAMHQFTPSRSMVSTRTKQAEKGSSKVVTHLPKARLRPWLRSTSRTIIMPSSGSRTPPRFKSSERPTKGWQYSDTQTRIATDLMRLRISSRR
jgi:hypothetical protein